MLEAFDLLKTTRKSTEVQQGRSRDASAYSPGTKGGGSVLTI